MAAGVSGFKLKVGINLFAGLHSGEHALPFQLFKFAAIQIDAEFRVDPVAMFFNQPVDTIKIATFFVGCKRQDQIAVGDKTFALQAEKAFDQDRIAFLHVLRAAPVEKSVFLNELEWIHGPVFAAGFHHIEVADEKDGLLLAGAMITHDEILFALVRAGDDDVFLVKAACEQPPGHSEALVTLPAESLVLVSINC